MCETSSWIKSFWYLTKHTYYVINNIMDILTHTIIAVGSLAGFFYAGIFLGKKNATRELADDMVSYTLDMLERDGLVRTEIKDGEKELIPISEIIKQFIKKIRRISTINNEIYIFVFFYYLVFQ